MNRLIRVKLRPQVFCGCLCRKKYSTAPYIRSWKLFVKHFKHNCLKEHVCLSYCRAITQFRWQHTVPPPPRREKYQRSIVIKPEMTIRQLASQMDLNPASLADILTDLGEELPNGLFTVLPSDLAELLVSAHDMIPLHDHSTKVTSAALLPRPPVVTIMGHVNHGKTTLLDTLRKSSVAATEAGGITQHIGAFSVPVSGGKKTITFIDTPGHAAFETMRARGANVTDVVILVVAADEGVKQQTVESIKHATNARVPIIVAINKVDRPRVNVEQTKQQLLQHGIQLEEYGGDVQSVEVSALKGINLEGLLEAIITLAELHDLKAKRDCPVEGIVLESRRDKGKGSVATVLVKNGTLKKGSIILVDETFAKVRLMFDSCSQVIAEATPSTPVEVIGWRELPSAGGEVMEVRSEQEACDVINKRKAVLRESKLFSGMEHNLLQDVERSYRGDPAPKMPSRDYDSSHKLNVVIKGDVDGSIEAINDALQTYKSRKVSLNVLCAEVGPVNENDVKLAETFKGTVFGFNVKISRKMHTFAKRLGISIREHKIIYKLLEDIKDELSNRLPPMEEETAIGEAAVLQVFHLTGSRKAVVAGCRVKKGSLSRDNLYRVIRNNEVLYEGKLSSMKRGQDDISQAKRETECGLSFENFTDVKEGDVIQTYIRTVKKQDIDWNWGF